MENNNNQANILIKDDITACFDRNNEMINPYAYKFFQDVLDLLNIKIILK